MSNCCIKIKDRFIGVNYPCYIIAEMSANHAGSLEKAIELVYAAKESGADCIKIQTYTPDTMTINSEKEYFQIKDGTWKGENLYRLYKKLILRGSGKRSSKKRQKEQGLIFYLRLLTKHR